MILHPFRDADGRLIGIVFREGEDWWALERDVNDEWTQLGPFTYFGDARQMLTATHPEEA